MKRYRCTGCFHRDECRLWRRCFTMRHQRTCKLCYSGNR